MHVDGANQVAVVVGDGQGIDLHLFHDVQCLGRQVVSLNGFAVAGHDVPDRSVVNVDRFVQGPAQVAIGKYAGQMPLGVHDGGHAQPFTADLQQGAAEGGGFRNFGNLVAGMHDVRNPQQQAPSQTAARVREGKVFGTEASNFQQNYGQRIAHNQGCCGAGCGCQAKRAGLQGNADIQIGDRFLSQHRVRVAGHADQRCPHAFDQGQNGHHFASAATVGDGNDYILRGDHAHVAVAGFTWVNKKGGCAGTGQCGCNLVADMAGFTHAGDHYPAFAGHDNVAGSGEVAVDTAFQGFDRFPLDADGSHCGGSVVGGVWSV